MPINLTQTAKELRQQSTDAERLLWRHLRAKQLEGLKFRRQEQIGRFIADFVCYEKMIIVEADGGQHALAVEKDEERTLWLNAQGFTVLRFTAPDAVHITHENAQINAHKRTSVCFACEPGIQ
jgi:very-short-patch-repair endonuclease